MPPSTAPTSVAVTSEAAWPWVSCRSAEIDAQHEAEDQEVEAVHGIADGGAPERLAGLAVDFGRRR
jgi:hypothetical protein